MNLHQLSSSSVAAKSNRSSRRSEILRLVRTVTSVWLRIEKWLLKGGGQRRRVKGQLLVRTSALSSIEAAHAPSGAVGRSSRAISSDGVLKVKIKLLKTGGIQKRLRAARSTVPAGRYKQARSSRMLGCMLACLAACFVYFTCLSTPRMVSFW